MVRYVAIYRGKQQPKSLRGLLIFCTTLAGLAGIAGALLLLFFTPTLVTHWITLKQHTVANKDLLNRAIALLQLMAPLIPLMTMQVMWFAGLRGFKAFKWRVLTTGILQPSLQIILLALVLIFFRTKDGITAVAVALFISTMFNTVLNLYFLFRQVERVATSEPEHYEVREWLTFASFNFLTTIIDTVLDSIDTILLAAFGVTEVAIGQYGAAIRLGNFIAMPLLSINNVFAPTIAELHSKGEMQKLESMFKLMTRWSVMFSLPIFLIMVLFAPYLLALPGPGFVAAWPLLIAFSVGSMINAGTGAVGYMLLMTGYQRLSFLNSLVAVVVNIVLGIQLTPRYGAMGTAISTGLAICALNFMRVLQVRVILKMHPYRWDVLKPVAAGVISAALVVALLYLLRLSHIHTTAHIGHSILSIQLLLIPVFLASYVVLIRQFKGSPEDEIVLQALHKKFLGGNKHKKKVKEA
jgi:O-antigen/teichoic acid export membrane protein